MKNIQKHYQNIRLLKSNIIPSVLVKEREKCHLRIPSVAKHIWHIRNERLKLFNMSRKKGINNIKNGTLSLRSNNINRIENYMKTPYFNTMYGSKRKNFKDKQELLNNFRKYFQRCHIEFVKSKKFMINFNKKHKKDYIFFKNEGVSMENYGEVINNQIHLSIKKEIDEQRKKIDEMNIRVSEL